MQTEDRQDVEYDCYLSGGVLTLVVIKDDYLYCANIGNVNAAIFFNEKVYTFKFKILEISTDNSAIVPDERKGNNKSIMDESSSYDCIILFIKFSLKSK